MIKFVHKSHLQKVKSSGKIVVTYTAWEIILGMLLLVTNIAGMVIIYHYVLNPQLPQRAPQNGNNLMRIPGSTPTPGIKQ